MNVDYAEPFLEEFGDASFSPLHSLHKHAFLMNALLCKDIFPHHIIFLAWDLSSLIIAQEEIYP